MYVERCHECSGKMIDTEDELVCTSCGSVARKEIVESREERDPQALDYTVHALGSYLGPMRYGYDELFSKGFSKSSSTYGYLKTVSDYSCRENSAVYSCAKMVERICEKLLIPKTVIGQAMSIATSVLETKNGRGEFNTASISAFSIITACKIHGVTNVGVREIMDAHRTLGHRVKASTIIQMSIESPIRPAARKAEEYLSRVVGRLPLNANLRACLREYGYNEVAYYHKLSETAKRILDMIDGSARGGHSPPALAASAVYAAEIALSRIGSRRKFMTQKDVASCVDIAEYTVREQYGEIFRPRADRILSVIMGRPPSSAAHPTKRSSSERLLEQTIVARVT
jgi:transcription initiation factor TFIIIB Brf1 subunit/transcription initiation factor TFIIB